MHCRIFVYSLLLTQPNQSQTRGTPPTPCPTPTLSFKIEGTEGMTNFFTFVPILVTSHTLRPRK